MKMIKCYEDYTKLRKSFKAKQYNLMNDSIGQYNDGEYSVDITLRDYDGNWCIDYDVYKLKGNPRYLDGGRVCDVFKMPLTDKGFWKLIKKKFKEHIKAI